MGKKNWGRKIMKEENQKDTNSEESSDSPDWMEEARLIAAQCWCDEDTSNIEMDPILAESVAKRISFWMETAAQNQRNTDYYRGLIVRCGEAIGPYAYLQYDGGISKDVICAKVPELVEVLFEKQLEGVLEYIEKKITND